VVVTDSLPSSVRFVSASPSQGGATPGAGEVHWDAGLLTNGATATNIVVVLPLSVGPSPTSPSSSLTALRWLISIRT